MNAIELKIEKMDSGKIDGVQFVDAILLRVFIDDKSIHEDKHLDVALVVFDELRRSLSGKDGLYLIFTSASGIADDGGWEGVQIKSGENVISWDFLVENKKFHYEFNRSQYFKEIKRICSELENIDKDLELEPTELFYPESWEYY